MRLTRLLVISLALGGYAFASPIGFLGIGSSGFVLATLTSSLFTLDPAAIGGPATCLPLAPGGGLCNGDVNTATTLAFAGGPLTSGEGILINGGFPIGAPPPPSAQIFNPFLQFALHPGLQFILLGVDPGSTNTNCAGLLTGQSCSILENGTPSNVVLTRSGSNTNVALSLFGVVNDGTGLSDWTGGFSATLPNITPLQVAQYFCGIDASCTPAEVQNSPSMIVRSVSGSFFVSPQAVPEPNTTVLLGAGLILLAFTLRRVKSA